MIYQLLNYLKFSQQSSYTDSTTDPTYFAGGDFLLWPDSITPYDQPADLKQDDGELAQGVVQLPHLDAGVVGPTQSFRHQEDREDDKHPAVPNLFSSANQESNHRSPSDIFQVSQPTVTGSENQDSASDLDQMLSNSSPNLIRSRSQQGDTSLFNSLVSQAKLGSSRTKMPFSTQMVSSSSFPESGQHTSNSTRISTQDFLSIKKETIVPSTRKNTTKLNIQNFVTQLRQGKKVRVTGDQLSGLREVWTQMHQKNSHIKPKLTNIVPNPAAILGYVPPPAKADSLHPASLSNDESGQSRGKTAAGFGSVLGSVQRKQSVSTVGAGLLNSPDSEGGTRSRVCWVEERKSLLKSGICIMPRLCKVGRQAFLRQEVCDPGSMYTACTVRVEEQYKTPGLCTSSGDCLAGQLISPFHHQC